MIPLIILELIAILLLVVIMFLVPMRTKYKRTRCVRLAFSLFPNIKIKGVSMSTVVKKSQFKDDGTGRLVIRGHITPETDDNQVESVEGGSESYTGNNDNAATIEKDPADPTKFIIVWVAAGDVQFSATADANLKSGDDNVTPISGTLDLTLEEDQATKLEMALDV